MMAPHLATAAERLAGKALVVKVNTEDHPDLAEPVGGFDGTGSARHRDHLVSGGEQLRDGAASEDARCAGDEDLHGDPSSS